MSAEWDNCIIRCALLVHWDDKPCQLWYIKADTVARSVTSAKSLKDSTEFDNQADAYRALTGFWLGLNAPSDCALYFERRDGDNWISNIDTCPYCGAEEEDWELHFPEECSANSYKLKESDRA